MKFKVWDEFKNRFRDEFEFFLSEKAELFYLSSTNILAKAPDGLVPVFSTSKADKNGVELFDGDKCILGPKGVDYPCEIVLKKGSWYLEYKNGVTHLLEDECYIEKVGSKYKEK